MKNLKKHLTLSALFVAGTMLSYTAHAEDINVSNISKLIEAIAKSGTNTANLQNDISATTPTTSFGCLGELKGTLTINGGTSKYGISGTYQENGTDIHYEGITVGNGKKLIIDNVGSVDTNGNIIKSWNGFAASSTATADGVNAYGGAIYNNYYGTVEINNSVFSKNYATATATADTYAYANAYGGAIYTEGGTVEITDSSFSNNYVSADGPYASAYGGAISNNSGTGTVEISNSSFSNNYVSADGPYASAYGGAIDNTGTVEISNSSFSKNYATATADGVNAYGGAIYNGSIVNIIASTKDSIFSGNYTEVNGRKTNNDIYNSGTTNLYAASGKTISFDGGIVSQGDYHSVVNINVKGEASYDVAGTVLFEAGSINSGNHFTLGAGTLKIEDGVSWRNNSLVMNGGTLDIGSSDTGNIGTLEYNGGSLTLNAGANINIDISETEHDQIVFSNNAQFILNGGKITVDLGDNIVVGSSFKVLEKFTWNGTETEFSDLVKLNNNPSNWSEAYSLIAKISLDESGSSLFIEVIPEPSMFGLFAGLAALALVGTRRRRK